MERKSKLKKSDTGSDIRYEKRKRHAHNWVEKYMFAALLEETTIGTGNRN